MTAYQATPDEKPRLEIEFCTKCRFQGRAFWMARELFDVVPEIVGEIALKPSSGGVFTVRYGGAIVWELATTDGSRSRRTSAKRCSPLRVYRRARSTTERGARPRVLPNCSTTPRCASVRRLSMMRASRRTCCSRTCCVPIARTCSRASMKLSAAIRERHSMLCSRAASRMSRSRTSSVTASSTASTSLCGPGALIPRPETEMLVEIALDEVRGAGRRYASPTWARAAAPSPSPSPPTRRRCASPPSMLRRRRSPSHAATSSARASEIASSCGWATCSKGRACSTSSSPICRT